jgi:glucose-1-phosphate cytidylyltransferase
VKAVILAGGLGTRLREETEYRPKPMVDVGGKPIIWHIMKLLAHHGVVDFIVCAGYRGDVIRDYFTNYETRTNDFTVHLGVRDSIEYHDRHPEADWKVTVAETGAETMTGGRVKRVERYVAGERCLVTYGDGLADVDIQELIRFHRSTGALVTLTAVDPPGRFGAIVLGESESRITHFREKPSGEGAYVNGGFFVVEPEALSYIRGGDATVWESEPLEQLAHDGHLAAFRHQGFFQPMDTLRDRQVLEELWASGAAPWKQW